MKSTNFANWDPGHRHFEWNRPRGNLYPGGERLSRPGRGAKAGRYRIALSEAGTRRVVGSVEPIILDVTDAGQIAAAVEIVRAKIAAGGRRHAIVNNAGAQMGRADRDNAAD